MTEENTQAEVPAQDAIAPETEAAEPSTATEETQVETPPQGEPEEPKKPSWAQKRIDELTRNWREEQRRNDALLQALNQQKQPESPKPAVEVKKPRLEDFGYDEAAYEAARDAWEEAQFDRRLQEREQQREQARKQQTFIERVSKSPTVMEALRDPHFPVNDVMAEVIRDSETSVELLEWIDANRDEARKIYSLPPHLSAKELGRIEARLEAEKEAKSKPPAPKPVPVVSQAPAPPPQIDDADDAAPVPRASDPSSDSLSIEDWRKQREKELRRKANRK